VVFYQLLNIVLLGSMAHYDDCFADTKRIDRLSGGKCQSSDFETANKKMVPFISGGFKAFCKNNSV
jgi:hypothetical protein